MAAEKDDIRERIYRDELTATEVGDRQEAWADEIGREFASDEAVSQSALEFALRNPAVLLDRLTAHQFAELPEEAQKAWRAAATEATALGSAAVAQREEVGLHMTDYEKELALPVMGFQQLAYAKDVPESERARAGKLTQELGSLFATTLKHAEASDWKNVTKEKRYFAGNTIMFTE